MKRIVNDRVTRRAVLRAGAALAPAMMMPGLVGLASAQDAYPTRAIDIIYGFGAGSSGDLTCRMTADHMSKKWKVPINVINKPGGNTVPASLDLYNAAPDGYTLMGDPPGSSSMIAAVVKDLPFKVMDRTFIAMIATNSLLLVVPANSPFNTLDELAADLKKDPGSFTWTSQGGAATSDLVFRKLAKAVGVDVAKTKPVTARSTPEITTLTAGGQVKLGCLIIATALPAIQSGLIKALALAADERSPSVPEVPTGAELGYPSISTLSFTGLSGPPKLPQSIIEIWETAIAEMLKDPGFIAQLNKIGSIPFYMDSKQFRDYIEKEAAVVQSLYG